MTRKRIKHVKIPNEGKRNSTFGKRLDGLLKKANELSILCGIDIAIIIHKKAESNAILWPSPAIFRERLQKFLDLPDMERERRMVTHEKYIEQILKVETEDLQKFKKTTELKESQKLMIELIQGKYFEGLYLNELNSLNSFSIDMLKKLQMRDNEVSNEQQQDQLLSLPPPLPLPTLPPPFLSSGIGAEASTSNFGGIGVETSSQGPTLLENLRDDQWFIDNMLDEQDIPSVSRVLPNTSGVTSSVSGGSRTTVGGINMPPSPNKDSDP